MDLYVVPGELENLQQKIETLSKSIFEIEDGFKKAWHGIDWEIKSAEQLNTIVEIISSDLTDCTGLFRKHISYLENARNSYIQTERELMGLLDDIKADLFKDHTGNIYNPIVHDEEKKDLYEWIIRYHDYIPLIPFTPIPHMLDWIRPVINIPEILEWIAARDEQHKLDFDINNTTDFDYLPNSIYLPALLTYLDLLVGKLPRSHKEVEPFIFKYLLIPYSVLPYEHQSKDWVGLIGSGFTMLVLTDILPVITTVCPPNNTDYDDSKQRQDTDGTKSADEKERDTPEDESKDKIQDAAEKEEEIVPDDNVTVVTGKVTKESGEPDEDEAKTSDYILVKPKDLETGAKALSMSLLTAIGTMAYTGSQSSSAGYGDEYKDRSPIDFSYQPSGSSGSQGRDYGSYSPFPIGGNARSVDPSVVEPSDIESIKTDLMNEGYEMVGENAVPLSSYDTTTESGDSDDLIMDILAAADVGDKAEPVSILQVDAFGKDMIESDIEEALSAYDAPDTVTDSGAYDKAVSSYSSGGGTSNRGAASYGSGEAAGPANNVYEEETAGSQELSMDGLAEVLPDEEADVSIGIEEPEVLASANAYPPRDDGESPFSNLFFAGLSSSGGSSDSGEEIRVVKKVVSKVARASIGTSTATILGISSKGIHSVMSSRFGMFKSNKNPDEGLSFVTADTLTDNVKQMVGMAKPQKLDWLSSLSAN